MLNKIATQVHGINVAKGFWGDPETLTEMGPDASPGERSIERDADGNLTPEFLEWAYPQLVHFRNFGELLMLIVTEASEAMEHWRDGKLPGEQVWVHPSGECCHGTRPCNQDPLAKPDGIPSELADIIIRVLDICGAYQIDIDTVLKTKMAYNATRPALHGRSR